MAATRPRRAARSETASVALESARAEHPSLQRIGGFSDGVFAFAITLLILAIRIPDPRDSDAVEGLLPLLTQQWRSYLAFVMSFMLIGVTWANHRILFTKFARADTALVWLNLLNLMIGGFSCPSRPRSLGGGWAAAATRIRWLPQCSTASAPRWVWSPSISWWYGAYGAKLTHAELSDAQRRAHTVAWAVAIPVLAVLTGIRGKSEGCGARSTSAAPGCRA
jgi:transmembrane protein TMEM174 (potassium channel)